MQGETEGIVCVGVYKEHKDRKEKDNATNGNVTGTETEVEQDEIITKLLYNFVEHWMNNNNEWMDENEYVNGDELEEEEEVEKVFISQTITKILQFYFFILLFYVSFYSSCEFKLLSFTIFSFILLLLGKNFFSYFFFLSKVFFYQKVNSLIPTYHVSLPSFPFIVSPGC